METITALEAKVHTLESQRQAAELELWHARNRAAGIALCDIVLDSRGDRYKVTEINHWSGNSVSLHGCKALKGGGWHKTPHYIGTSWRKA